MIDRLAFVDPKLVKGPFQSSRCKNVAEVLQFKAIKPRARRSPGEANGRKAGAAPPGLGSLPAQRTNADIAVKAPEGGPSHKGVVKQALIPLVILLCSIAAFYICLAHMSGQPGYSARNNLSSPTSIE
uniref:hypothetical protein n=1 Tax=Rhizobium rhizogenes TaxID=359 RepID=UPI0019106AA9|nr:hypothetical protein [Rhizobium rhizogenes]